MLRTYQFDALSHTRVSGAMAQRLVAEGQRRHFADGAMIQQKGDLLDGFWLITAGRVTARRLRSDGALTLFGVFGPGDLFGDLAYFAGLERQVDALADGPADLVWVDGALVRRLLAAEPDFALLLLQSLATQLRTMIDRVEEGRQMTPEARLAHALANMAAMEGPRLTCTQQELSDFIGVSRVTTGQILSRFAKAGLIERGYGWIAVPDGAALRARFGGQE
jgi:CRP-like cAMP-binding protein